MVLKDADKALFMQAAVAGAVLATAFLVQDVAWHRRGVLALFGIVLLADPWNRWRIHRYAVSGKWPG